MVVVQSLKKEHWVKNCSDLAKLFIKKIDYLVSLKCYTEIILVFDSYKPYSLKQITREHRNEGEDSVHYVVDDNSNIDQITLKKFLKNETTKKELTVYLSYKLVNHAKSKYLCRFFAVADNKVIKYVATPELESKFNHNEADTLLIFYAVDFTDRHSKASEITVYTSDTDILFLLLYFYNLLCQNVKMVSSSQTYDINNLYHKLGEDTCSSLLALHAITGCDTVGRFAGKGKVAWHAHKEYKRLNPDFIITLQKFGNIAKVVDGEQTVLEKYISYAYTKKELTLGDARWYTLTRKFGEAEKLPPTASSFKQHLLRAVYQTFVWKQSIKRLITYPDASNFGWRQVNGKWSPFPTDKPYSRID